MEKVRREKMQVREKVQVREEVQMREKVGKSRITVFFQCFVAPEGRKVGSLKRRVSTGLQKEEDGKPLLCDKRDRAITCGPCVFRRDLHLTLLCSGLLQKYLLTLEEGEV